ncbi:MAG: HD-GYP domain-containing protein [Candidatus Saccharimonadales bacterium]
MVSKRQTICNVMVNAIRSHDATTGRHAERTTAIVGILIDLMLRAGIYHDEIAEWDTNIVIPSALLHDIGKIAISDLILRKPDRLTKDEYEIMKTHTTKGEHIIDYGLTETGYSMFLEHARRFAGAHHERWDGSGYPRGLKRAEIPLEARILAPADVYDALTADRPYRAKLPHDAAMDIVVNGGGSQFDPKIIGVFQSVGFYVKNL